MTAMVAKSSLGPGSQLAESEQKLGLSTTSRRERPEPMWKKNDAAARKEGQRSTIYWVGKSIMAEDGSKTTTRTKGASYHGEWAGDEKNGYGVQVFPSGQKYEGQWSNGLRDGEGTLWVPLGKAAKLRKLYVGTWKDDRRHGRGTCFFKSGEFYQGSWEYGRMHGHGTMRYASGDLYIGEWNDGLRSGQGTLTKASGDTYEGCWLEDKREGTGSHFYAESGKVFVGEWANDQPKAGVFTQASPNPDQAVAVPVTTTLPQVKLARPEEVIEAAQAAACAGRRGFRAQATPPERLFSTEEIDALRGAFEAVQHEGMIKLEELQDLCLNLGTEVDLPRLERMLKDIGRAEDAPQLGFTDFLRVVALLLDEEAGTLASDPQASGESYLQESGDVEYDLLPDGDEA